MNLLYFSCHEQLEAQEVSILSKLGFNVFSIGHYVDTRNPVNPTQTISLPFNQELFELFCRYHNIEEWQSRIGKLRCGDLPPYILRIHPDFAKIFSVVIIGYYEENLTLNWDYIKNKCVVLRRICQIPYHRSPFRGKVRLVHMAECEREMNSQEPDALIRHACDTNFHSGYVGGTDIVLTIQKWLRKRQRVSAFPFYDAVTAPFNRIACGFGNEDMSYGISGLTQEELQVYRQKCAVYFQTPTKPGNMSYGFIEALSTGCPMVITGPIISSLKGYENNYEAHKYIKNGVSGFFSDDVRESQEYIRYLLNNPAQARLIGENGRRTAIQNFSLERATDDWANLLKKVL